MEAIVSIVCALLGLALGFFVAKVRMSQQVESAKAEAQATNESLKGTVANLQADLRIAVNNVEVVKQRAAEDAAASIERERIAKADAAQQLAAAKAEMRESHQKALEDQQKQFDILSAKLVAEAKVATEAMVKQRQQEISQAGNATIENVVNPLKETIAKMEKTMNDTTLQQTEVNTSLKDALKAAMESNESTKKTADELVRAFRHDRKIQGNWGERVLGELLESLGLKEGIHYDVQKTLLDESGKAIRHAESNGTLIPDVVVHLDDTKDVVVDSKVSMDAFMSYMSEEDVEKRKQYLKAHINSIKEHVKSLSSKDYSSYIVGAKKSMDFVIMFVPRSAALWTAMSEEPSLWRDAMAKNVFIADEQTLYAALRMIKLTWRQIQQAENQKKVFALANEILKRAGLLTEYVESTEKKLKEAVDAFGGVKGKITGGGQSILTCCRNLEKIGAKQDANHPIRYEDLEEQDDSV